ncbi:hypothetical protein ABT009_34180 [Streptomyces sp. NPDC002896]|uniref:hypothetical protein n=1 Tax=Streptomyces sp. NPDC002896 TaxID=3154438 RepID=UPI0033247521
MQTGELLGSGRSADVFAIDDHWVLRRYLDGGDTTAEATVMAYLAQHGYPVPHLREPATATHGTRPRGDLVMQRLHGPSMLQALLQGTVTAEDAGAALAGLLHRSAWASRSQEQTGSRPSRERQRDASSPGRRAADP